MKNFLSILCICVLFPLFVYAESERTDVYEGVAGMPDYKGEFNLLIKHLPKFEDYPADTSPFKAVEKVDWDYSKHLYKDRIDDQLKDPTPNVSGYYKIISVGCGTSCQVHTLINIKTGKPVDGFSSSYGFVGRLDSRLIIVNPTGLNGLLDLDGELGAQRQISFYEINNNKLTLISQIQVKGETYCFMRNDDDKHSCESAR